MWEDLSLNCPSPPTTSASETPPSSLLGVTGGGTPALKQGGRGGGWGALGRGKSTLDSGLAPETVQIHSPHVNVDTQDLRSILRNQTRC